MPTAAAARVTVMSLVLLACACREPPPNKVLEVRHLPAKCALVRFSSCPQPEPASSTQDDADAGSES